MKKLFFTNQRIIFVLTAFLFLFQVSVFAQNNRNQQTKLGQNKWVLRTINGEKVYTDRAFINFEPSKRQIRRKRRL